MTYARAMTLLLNAGLSWREADEIARQVEADLVGRKVEAAE